MKHKAQLYTLFMVTFFAACITDLKLGCDTEEIQQQVKALGKPKKELAEILGDRGIGGHCEYHVSTMQLLADTGDLNGKNNEELEQIRKLLLEAGRHNNKEDQNGDTPLIKAIEENDPNAVRLILEKNDAINKKLAEINERLAIPDYDPDAEVNIFHGSPLQFAVFVDNSKAIIKALLSKPKYVSRQREGIVRGFRSAIMIGNQDAVDTFLDICGSNDEDYKKYGLESSVNVMVYMLLKINLLDQFFCDSEADFDTLRPNCDLWNTVKNKDDSFLERLKGSDDDKTGSVFRNASKEDIDAIKLEYNSNGWYYVENTVPVLKIFRKCNSLTEDDMKSNMEKVIKNILDKYPNHDF